MTRALFGRLDSLFVRLLLTQLGLVIALQLVFGVLFYQERTSTVAVLYADLWAPQLAQAAGVSANTSSSLQILRSTAAPVHVLPFPAIAPRFMAIRERLKSLGVDVRDMQLSRQGADGLMVWIQILAAEGRPMWLGIPAQVVLPEWPVRLLIAMGIVTVMMVVGSWSLTRRLTRPLDQLRQRMQTHAPGGPMPKVSIAAGSSPEIVAMDRAYTELLARLERHERERSILLAGVSHDLRSPLARIRMAAALLPDDAGSTTRQDSIARNVVVADHLIESFLDFVRSDVLAFDQTVDLAEAARRVASRFDRPIEELKVLAPSTLPWPYANSLLVERLMSNLIDNAFKHGRAPVTLRLQGDRQQVRLTVEDTGDGIDPLEVDRLQEAFSRGSTSRTVPGTGLGLAIVRQIAQRLGGSLDFETHRAGHIVGLTLTLQPTRN